MKIWLINHYAVPPQYYPLARPSLFAKNLIKMGHDVTIIAASTVHNSESKNLIEGRIKIKKIVDDGIPYVLINCMPYQGNGVKRVINILQFARKLASVLETLEKPDAVVSTSFDPLSCYEGVKYAKKHGIKAVAEIADLWPETLIEYNGVSPNNLIVKYLRRIEKSIYKESDAVVFLSAGDYNSIVDQGWEKEFPREKFYNINNGIDNEQFEYNRTHYSISDEDLENTNLFKVVYTGSIRKVNDVGGIIDIAKKINNEQIVFLIWGEGDELDDLRGRVVSEEIKNVRFKGRVDKKYIPYITSKADLNFVHNKPSPLLKYGISFNKLFDYLAAGKPIICDFPCDYNPVLMGNAGVSVDSADPEEIAKQIEQFTKMEKTEYDKYCLAAQKTAKEYDFKVLTQKLVDILQ